MYDKNMLEIEKMVTGNLLILNLHAVILSDRLLSITSFTLKLERGNRMNIKFSYKGVFLLLFGVICANLLLSLY